MQAGHGFLTALVHRLTVAQMPRVHLISIERGDFPALAPVLSLGMPKKNAVEPIAAPVGDLRGVGPKMSEKLARLEIHTVGDLLFHLPARYARIAQVRPLSEWVDGDTARIEVTVKDARVHRGPRVTTVVAKATDDDDDEVQLTWFGQQWLAKRLPGMRIVCQGPLTRKRTTRLDVREWDEADDLLEQEYASSLRPVYPATEGLKQGRIRALISQAIDTVPGIPDPLPSWLRERFGLPTLWQSLLWIHQPQTDQDPTVGRRRLVFDEFFPIQLALLLLRRRDARRPAFPLVDGSLTSRVIDSLPFTLSPGQTSVWAHIRPRLSDATPARVLLQGEVGSGKTVIAALAAAQAAGSGRLAAILVPTEILARQHLASLTSMLEPAGLPVEYISGAQPPAEREEAISRLESGDSRVVVGTHALFSKGLRRFADRLGVVVVDEQHRFGVEQRHALVEATVKGGQGAHLIQLSATPIPRTMAMTVFGDLDIVDLPLRAEARRKVRTTVSVGWIDALTRAATRNEASFVICPRIDESIESPGRAVLSDDLAHELNSTSLRFAIAHGRQPAEERADAIEALIRGEIDVLVATTVIEVGIDIARASTIVILDADRFGLAQLHQLRGRVGRVGQDATCVLVASEEADEESFERLQAMVRLDDGMALAEFDLEQRGAGALSGISQAGHRAFRVASLTRDGRTLVEARHAAKLILEQAPTLTRSEHRAVRVDVLARISQMLRVAQG